MKDKHTVDRLLNMRFNRALVFLFIAISCCSAPAMAGEYQTKNGKWTYFASGNCVTNIEKDKSNKNFIWFAATQEILRYDIQKDKWKEYTSGGGNHFKYERNYIVSDRDNVWLFNDNNLFVYNPTVDDWKLVYPLAKHPWYCHIPYVWEKPVMPVFNDENHLWVACSRFDEDNKHLGGAFAIVEKQSKEIHMKDLPIKPTEQITAVAMENDVFWIGTYDSSEYRHHILRYDKYHEKLEYLDKSHLDSGVMSPSSSDMSPPPPKVWEIVVWENMVIFSMTDRSVQIFHKMTNRLDNKPHRKDDRWRLLHGLNRWVPLKEENRDWYLHKSKAGDYILSKDPLGFLKPEEGFNIASGFLERKAVTDFIVDNQVVWIGTESGILKYDLANKNHKWFHFGPNLSQCSSGWPITLLVSDFSENNLWIYNTGFVNLFNRSSQKWEYYDSVAGSAYNTPVLFDKNRIYFLTQKEIVIFDKRQRKWETIPSEGTDKAWHELMVYKLGESKVLLGGGHSSDCFWEESSRRTYKRANFFLYDLKSKKWKGYFHEDGLVKGRVTDIHEDDGHIWIGHCGGLSKYSLDDNSFQVFEEINQYLIDEIFQIHSDEQYVYITARVRQKEEKLSPTPYAFNNIRLFKFNKERLQFEILTPDILLTTGEFFLDNHNVWLGTYGGLAAFNKSDQKIMFLKILPTLQIELPPYVRTDKIIARPVKFVSEGNILWVSGVWGYEEISTTNQKYFFSRGDGFVLRYENRVGNYQIFNIDPYISDYDFRFMKLSKSGLWVGGRRRQKGFSGNDYSDWIYRFNNKNGTWGEFTDFKESQCNRWLDLVEIGKHVWFTDINLHVCRYNLEIPGH